MVRALQAGFGTSIAGDMPGLVELGVQGIRLDCQGLDALTTLQLVGEVQNAGLVPLAIVDSTAQLALLPVGVNVEWGNEPDLARHAPPTRGVVAPAAYRASIDAAWAECERLGLYLWAGCPSNLIGDKGGRGLQWLEAAEPWRWPESVNVSFHRYPDGDSALNPHRGFRDRAEEVDALRRLAGHRRLACTEFGYHQADRRTPLERTLSSFSRGLFPPRRWSEQQVADAVTWEWTFWEAVGALGAVLYQHRDGPTSVTSAPTALDTYGIRRFTDDAPKPVAFTFRRDA